jgi:hypothetical protein
VKKANVRERRELTNILVPVNETLAFGGHEGEL